MRPPRRSAPVFHGGLLCLLLLLPLLRGGWDQWAQSLVVLAWAFLGGLSCLLTLRGRGEGLALAATTREAFPLAVFFVGGGVSTFLSAFPHSVIPALLNDIPAAAFFVLTASLNGERRAAYTRAFAAGGVLPVGAAFLGRGGDPAGLLSGPLVNPNVLAGLGVMGLPLLTALSLDPALGRRERWGWRAGAAVTVLGLLSTGSFMAYLVLALEAMVFLATGFRRRRVGGRELGVGAVVLGGVGAAAFLFRSDWPKLFHGEPDRLAWWGTAFNMVRAHPLWGVGPGAFGEAYPAFRATEWGLNSLYAHNFLLEFSAERGLLGAGAFLLFLFGLARRGVASDRGRALALGLGGFCVFNLVNIGFSFPALYWFFFAGAGLLWGESRPARAAGERSGRWRRGIGGLLFWAAAGLGAFALFRAGQHTERARLAFGVGDMAGARAHVEAGLRWNRWSPELYDLRAALRWVQKDMGGAARDMARCVALAPAGAGFRRDAAELAARRGDRAEALRQYDRAVQLMPLSPAPWVRRGDLQREAGDPAAARASYEKALQALSHPAVLAGHPVPREALTDQARRKIQEIDNASKN